MHLSYIVFTCATVPTCLALALAWPSRWQLNREPLRCASVLALGYSAAVGYTVALAASSWLACSSTKLLGKHSSGSIHPLSWLFMLPYHIGLRLKLGVQRLVSPEPLYNRVLPGWYIGGWPWSGSELPSDGPSVLDCTCELPRTHRNRYLCLPVWDTQAPPAAVIERGVAFAMSERALGKAVYVHCAHGHGRSALLLIACLLEGGHVGSWEEGLAALQAARPRVHLNRRQQRALELWARSRRTTTTTAGGGGGHLLQMQALYANGGVGSSAAAAAAAPPPPPSSVASFTSAVQRRGSTGGASDGGGGDPDGGARVHLLADSRDAGLPLSTAVMMPYGLESRLVGLAATVAAAAGGLHQGSGSMSPLGDSLRAAGVHLAAGVMEAEDGKKLS